MNNTVMIIENGMSSFELLQAKISSLETRLETMRGEVDRRTAAIDAMRQAEQNHATSRRERFELSVEIPVQCESLKYLHNECSKVASEIRGLRTAMDLIITVSNYGGEVTQKNRRMIEGILNY